MRNPRGGYTLTVVLCLLMMTSLLVLPSMGGEAPTTDDGWNVYTDRKWGYTVQYPRDWTVQMTRDNLGG